MGPKRAQPKRQAHLSLNNIQGCWFFPRNRLISQKRSWKKLRRFHFSFSCFCIFSFFIIFHCFSSFCSLFFLDFSIIIDHFFETFFHLFFLLSVFFFSSLFLYTLICRTHILLRTGHSLRTSAHLHACHIPAWLKYVKRAFAHVSHLSISLSLSRVSPIPCCSRTVTSRVLPTTTSLAIPSTRSCRTYLS